MQSATLVFQNKDTFSRKPAIVDGVCHDSMHAVAERDFQNLQGVCRASDSLVLRAWSASVRTRSSSAHSRQRAKRAADGVASNSDSIISSRPVDQICPRATCRPAWAGPYWEVEPRYRLCSGTRPGFGFRGLLPSDARLKSSLGFAHFGLLPLSWKDPFETSGFSLPASPSRWWMLQSAYQTQVQGRKSHRPNCEEQHLREVRRSSTHGQTLHPVRCADEAVVSAEICELPPEDLGALQRDQGSCVVHWPRSCHPLFRGGWPGCLRRNRCSWPGLIAASVGNSLWPPLR